MLRAGGTGAESEGKGGVIDNDGGSRSRSCCSHSLVSDNEVCTVVVRTC